MHAKTIGLIALAALTLAVVGTTTSVRHVFAPGGHPFHGSSLSINFDNSGNPLTGANNYTIHFTQIPPPVWTFTSYNKNNTPYNRITSFDVKENTDGSLDIYVQHQTPAKDKESNWLPSPKDSFSLILQTPVTWPVTVQRTR